MFYILLRIDFNCASTNYANARLFDDGKLRRLGNLCDVRCHLRGIRYRVTDLFLLTRPNHILTFCLYRT